MELTNEFSVDVPIERAWDVLTDVETIAPCLPGAQLQEIEGDEYRGVVKVKVGPITAQYKGKATFVEQDAAARRVVIKGDGRDTRGQGNASALITAQLHEDGPSRTRVEVATELTVTGKVAQFGRGVMGDVSSKLMAQFADNLSAVVLGNPTVTAAAPEAPATPERPAATPEAPADAPTNGSGTRRTMIPNESAAAGGAVRKLDLPDPEPIDLVGTAGTPILKRAAPAIGLLAVLLLVLRRLFRGR